MDDNGADQIFAHRRLAQIYDPLDPDRSDLDPYLAMLDEFDVGSLLDIGCGTGTFACAAARRNRRVVGVDPARASLDVAAAKPGADRVNWVHGTAVDVDVDACDRALFDLATMTANVAQVFTTDDDWKQTLSAAAAAVRPGGVLAFETRDPKQRAWEQWNRRDTFRRVDLPDVGLVETWVDVTNESLPLVSFRHTWRFESDGAVLTSDSTLRFRDLDAIRTSLSETGWRLDDVRDAPDRPGLEWVCIAVRDL